METVGEPSHRSPDPVSRAQDAAPATGEGAIEGYRELLESAACALADVEQALAALDEGSYGTCAACGEPIADGDLAADPTARACASHRAP